MKPAPYFDLTDLAFALPSDPAPPDSLRFTSTVDRMLHQPRGGLAAPRFTTYLRSVRLRVRVVFGPVFHFELAPFD